MGLDQGHLGLDRRRDIGADQAAGPGSDYHQVPLETTGAVPTGINPAPPGHLHHPFGQEGKYPQQGKGADQNRREDIASTLKGRQPGAGIDVNHGTGQHSHLADPVKGEGTDRGQGQYQIDQEKGEERHQPQGEEIEGPFPLDSPIDRGQTVT